MSVIKKLYTEELYPVEDFNFKDIDEEKDKNNFDFKDIDEDPPVEGDDDGVYNFGYLDIPGTETAEGDYDMETNITPSEEEVVGDDYDFFDIDEDPPVEGDDDGVYNFGYLDIPDSETAEGDYDMEAYSDPNEYDFLDIAENPNMKHTQFDIEYDFGEAELLGFQVTKDWLFKATRDSVEEMKHSHYNIYEAQLEQQAIPCIIFQYYYNERTNKSFIQFNMQTHNKEEKYEWNRGELIERITIKIKNKFRNDTGIYPEIMNRSQKDINCDNRKTITPYTIGYWYSLDGIYETIEDKAEVLLDAKKFMLPPPETMYNGVIIEPDKKIEDFFEIVNNIIRDYKLIENKITEDNKNEYITKYYQILKETHGTGDYYDRIDALNAEYYPDKYNNANIPEAMNRYIDEYREFFRYNLPRIHNYTKRFAVAIDEIA